MSFYKDLILSSMMAFKSWKCVKKNNVYCSCASIFEIFWLLSKILIFFFVIYSKVMDLLIRFKLNFVFLFSGVVVINFWRYPIWKELRYKAEGLTGNAMELIHTKLQWNPSKADTFSDKDLFIVILFQGQRRPSQSIELS